MLYDIANPRYINSEISIDLVNLDVGFPENELEFVKVCSFQTHYFLCLNSQPTHYQSGVITITLKILLSEGNTESFQERLF